VPLTISPWQRTDLEKFGLTEIQARERVYLFRDGELFGGHECFAELMSIQGDPFHLLVARTMRAPGIRVFSAAGYRFVARNRHRLPGGTPACEMPTE
jgi:predicted DCC family thiol-disulfide oxidoreductase YuxK